MRAIGPAEQSERAARSGGQATAAAMSGAAKPDDAAGDVHRMAPAPPRVVRRICHAPLRSLGQLEQWAARLELAASLGFDHLLVSPLVEEEDDAAPARLGDHLGEPVAAKDGAGFGGDLARLASAARGVGLGLFVNLPLDRFAPSHPFVVQHPEVFGAVEHSVASPVDPRSRGRALRPQLSALAARDALCAFTVRLVGELAGAGIAGCRVVQAQALDADFWTAVIAQARSKSPGFVFIAETQGAAREAVLGLAGCGFDALTSSLPWWDGRARWFVEEYEALRPIAPLIAEVAPAAAAGFALADDPSLVSVRLAQRLLLAAATGSGLLAPFGEVSDAPATMTLRGEEPPHRADPASKVDDLLRTANALSRELARFDGELRLLTGEGAAVTVLLRADAQDVRRSTAALLILINPDVEAAADVGPDPLALGGADFEAFKRVDGHEAPFSPLAPGEVRLLLARRAQPIVNPRATDAASAQAAAATPRLVVEGITPKVEGGAFPVRRVVGDTLEVRADIFGDGHEQLAAELQWRTLDQVDWTAVAMRPLGNDVWTAGFALDRLGRYAFAVEAWLDVFGGFARDYAKKRVAGVAQDVDVQEGCGFVRQAVERGGEHLDALKALQARLDAANVEAAGDILLQASTLALMQAADARPFRLRSPVQPVDAERLQARFASWYELFPRSQTSDAARHGTFDDVITRLPVVRAMGFDVLYFPPIHPIGKTNRKGPNNTLTPAPSDPGSPYAIGSEAGGHDAIHPELGSLEDFRRLVSAAADHGLEIALDFAIQCSPDHPWLKQHPGWFDWRPDGSIKYAENPPKKYQDIVNVDFYKPDAVPDLWRALRDIVLLWVGEGVRLFRVDNPHTKPLPFWEWMIGEVRSVHPDVVFLAEAFTRPKVMYRLAKIGFSQSYTYFTWRHTKAEFIGYLTELTQTAPKEFFRPHFFVNTPDINPPFLQTSGRGGFLIRAALAATLSGLWGVYSGFELCESEPLPGKEEYADSEKYEIRPRPARTPGDIVDEITRLNRIRKGHPALQTHLGITFLPAWNDNVLVYAKVTAALDDVAVVAVSLDPHGPQDTHFDLPLAEWGLADDAQMEAEDLVWERRFGWSGRTQHVRLDPGHPYAIWSLRLLRPEKTSRTA